MPSRNRTRVKQLLTFTLRYSYHRSSIADARVLVCRAAQALKGNAPADDMVMADRFGLAVASA